MSRVNVGTIGHVDHGRTALTSALLAVAAAGALMASNQQAIMPTRRPEFEPGYFDMNNLLEDPGKHQQRKARKAERKDRLKAAQRRALEGK